MTGPSPLRRARYGIEAVLFPGEVVNLSDGSEHPKRQHIYLEETQRVDVILIPRDIATRLHRLKSSAPDFLALLAALS